VTKSFNNQPQMFNEPNDSSFTELYPPLSFYEPDTKLMSRSIAQRVMELVTDRRVTRKSLRVPMHYVPGATIGPAPRAAG
jgi:DNA-binding LacI/PurR family transcriptional regulator